MSDNSQRLISDVLSPRRSISRVATKISTRWLAMTYPFAAFGRHVSIHHSCDVTRAASPHIEVADDVFAASDVWLNIVVVDDVRQVRIALRKGCRIGRRCTISAKNYIEIGEDVLMAPSVLIMDHNHEFRDPAAAIHAQGVTGGGQIRIGRNCWLGYGCVISCGRGELSIGRNSVVGANSVVTQNVPAFSVVAGNPARVIRQYEPESGEWRRPGFERSA